MKKLKNAIEILFRITVLIAMINPILYSLDVTDSVLWYVFSTGIPGIIALLLEAIYSYREEHK